MFSYFFSAQTPFEDTEKFGSSAWFVNQLRLKCDELKTAYEASEDKTTLACQKYLILSPLVTNIEKEIKEFNQLKASINPIENLKTEFEFTSKLLILCIPKLNDHFDILAKPRDNRRKNADMSLQFCGFSTVLGTMMVFTPSLPVALLLGLGVSVSESVVRYLTGTSDPCARSGQLLLGLVGQLLPRCESLDKLYKEALLEQALQAFGLKTIPSAQEIASLYRRKSLQCHPDRHPEKNAQFIELTAAYETLKQHIEQEAERNNAQADMQVRI